MTAAFALARLHLPENVEKEMNMVVEGKKHCLKLAAFCIAATFMAFGAVRNCTFGTQAAECSRAGTSEPNISVFAKFIRNIATQRGISKAEAADLLYRMGVRGFDAGPGEHDLDELAATRLTPHDGCPPFSLSTSGSRSRYNCLWRRLRRATSRFF